MPGEEANYNKTTSPNNSANQANFALPEDIEDLIEKCEEITPCDIWMEYLATLPTDTSREELARVRPLFLEAATLYLEGNV